MPAWDNAAMVAIDHKLQGNDDGRPARAHDTAPAALIAPATAPTGNCGGAPVTRSPAAAQPRTALVLSTNSELTAFLQAHADGRNIAAGPDFSFTVLPSGDERLSAAESTALQRAHRFDLPLVKLGAITCDPAVVALVPPASARRLHFVPVCEHAGVIGVAVEDPADAEIIPTLNFLTDLRIALMIAEPQDIRAAIAANFDRVEDRAILRQLGMEGTPNKIEDDEQAERRLASEQPIVRLVGDIFVDAARRRASDIHLRPGEHGMDLLYRIDNDLVPIRRFLHALQPALVSRIKVLANMNVAEHRLPQDGRATHASADGHPIDMRVSIIPTIHGESVVIRLLDPMQGLRSIDTLGLSPADATKFLDLIGRSHGMILVTGPTGSGKSTTLYAALLEARKERVNILTVEDPVEYHIEEVQQMQVNRAAGFTFASALRNILRHDPDVIMLGEIRDCETAQIAVESALTGHLLLSTLHTNTAATTITRLLDLGVESFLLRSTLLGVLSQRLTRRNCPHCLVAETVPVHWREMLDTGADEVFYRGSGCHRCEGLGVRGRVAVYELMLATPAIRRLIVPRCEADGIQEVALREGMVSLTCSAVALARSGVISLGEAFRLRAD
jgi:type IV pilus assembly protein PilB